ncbi:MAG: ubiquinone biosynthesis protein UbiE [Lachnospiraceae bacterium]|nr:ubiquinone biosynthesis protein UbiE [Lachnospiraceae bacterium]
MTEEFFNGFCKAQNQSRMVICEFEIASDGKRSFIESDCAYGACSHSAECLLMKQALEGADV